MERLNNLFNTSIDFYLSHQSLRNHQMISVVVEVDLAQQFDEEFLKNRL